MSKRSAAVLVLFLSACAPDAGALRPVDWLDLAPFARAGLGPARFGRATMVATDPGATVLELVHASFGTLVVWRANGSAHAAVLNDDGVSGPAFELPYVGEYGATTAVRAGDEIWLLWSVYPCGGTAPGVYRMRVSRAGPQEREWLGLEWGATPLAVAPLADGRALVAAGPSVVVTSGYSPSPPPTVDVPVGVLRIASDGVILAVSATGDAALVSADGVRIGERFTLAATVSDAWSCGDSCWVVLTSAGIRRIEMQEGTVRVTDLGELALGRAAPGDDVTLIVTGDDGSVVRAEPRGELLDVAPDRIARLGPADARLAAVSSTQFLAAWGDETGVHARVLELIDETVEPGI